ncbi:C69 family dipeptidase [Thermofilum pendens]|uniref:Peptidase U34, dipeptidase n=1 Tax=Thermofilum pendens (strain DSM 2475 / Hrk 5) TaxID=368408 RepID=A1S0B4_THEPD|nr:C69 family dipeptidase [Thermofilum pendens]ABL78894.1 peptidase U34, dipeptidase [Thermofilum pendens Hrk 5]
MCDTLVALRGATRDGVTIFAKNSDREPNEAQVLEFVPRMRHTEERVRVTYVEVEQVDETYAVLISRPFWMWGAEMGVNEFGVAVGNEAVFTRGGYSKTGLTGMDLVRLALERSRTAREALKWITSLLEEYGQGGNCSYFRKMFYNNSFLVADPREAWVLETVGREWVAERVESVRSISNALTIGERWDSSSPGLEEAARRLGCRSPVNFRECFSDFLYTRVSKGRERHRYTQGELEKAVGKIDFFFVASLLRRHSREPYEPSRGSNADICMHAGGLTRPSQTAASMIALLYEEAPVAFVTGTSTPCISAYKPVFLSAGLPDLGPKPSHVFDGGASYWWKHELLSRKLLCGYSRYAGVVAREMERVERKYFEKAMEARTGYLKGLVGAEELRRITAEAFREAAEVEERLAAEVKASRCLNPLYALYWRRINREASLTA